MATTTVDVNSYGTIQLAIDAVTFAAGSVNNGCVLFPADQYTTSTPLYVGYDNTLPDFLINRCRRDLGEWPGERFNRVVLKCPEGQARISYTGALTDDYLLYYTGAGSQFMCMNNLRFDCNDNCRGVFAAHLAYQTGFDHVSIRESIGVGFDLMDCWTARFLDCAVVAFGGVGVRLWRANGSTIFNTSFSSGQDRDWPDPNETHIRDSSGNILQVAEENQCVLYAEGSNLFAQGTNVESCVAPVGIYTHETESANWINTRFEGNTIPSSVKLAQYSRHQVWQGFTFADSGTDYIFDVGDDVANCKFGGIRLTSAVGKLFRVGERFHGNVIEGIAMPSSIGDKIGDIGTLPNNVEGMQVGYIDLPVGETTISVVYETYFYGMRSMTPMIKIPAGGTLQQITDARVGQSVVVQANGKNCTVYTNSNGLNRPYYMKEGEALVLIYTGSYWTEKS